MSQWFFQHFSNAFSHEIPMSCEVSAALPPADTWCISSVDRDMPWTDRARPLVVAIGRGFPPLDRYGKAAFWWWFFTVVELDWGFLGLIFFFKFDVQYLCWLMTREGINTGTIQYFGDSNNPIGEPLWTNQDWMEWEKEFEHCSYGNEDVLNRIKAVCETG